jgi:tyrosinase
MSRTRKDVWKLTNSEDDRTLFWYAQGVAEMQSRPFTDSTSWRYQSAVHGYARSSDPFAQPTDQLPDTVEQNTYWNRCQHATWFFLPWHRMYLLYFEQILLEIVKELGGPEDWALPYWNYSDRSNPQAQTLPLAFRSERLPDGTNNPLWVRQRGSGVNDGNIVGTSNSVSLNCLRADKFTNEDIVQQFGGGKTGFAHFGSSPGQCEGVPHNIMHVDIGGPIGWMIDPDTAALDPIFWLHHANIDRLWEVWLRRESQHQNPIDSDWLNFQFDFRDVNRNPITLSVSQAIDLTSPLLDYTYEDLSDPLPRSFGLMRTSLGRVRTAVAVETTPIDAIDTDEPVLEMVGASDERRGIILGQEQKSIGFALQTPPGLELFSMLRTADRGTAGVPKISSTWRTIDREVYLNLENITATKKPIDSYLVYVNLPDGAKVDNYPELKAGIIPSFGIIQASKPDREHPGDGVSYCFEITDIVSFLEPQGLWNPDNFRVSFVPYSTEAEREAVPDLQPVKVGRVSVYYR